MTNILPLTKMRTGNEPCSRPDARILQAMRTENIAHGEDFERIEACSIGRRECDSILPICLSFPLARELGADLAVNYREPHWADLVRAEFEAVDVVFDGVGGAIGRTAFALLRPAGRFSPYGMASGSFADISQSDADQRAVMVIRGGPLTPEQMLELARTALSEAANGWLRPVIGQRFPLERAADAHAAIESRATLGKTLLVVGTNAESA